jgi:hypothetical protein
MSQCCPKWWQCIPFSGNGVGVLDDHCTPITICFPVSRHLDAVFPGYLIGVLGVACWLLVPKIAGSNPAEAVGFSRAKKSPLEGK